MALGFWEACGGHVCRRTLRGFGLISNIKGARVWFYRYHLGIYALLLWAKRGGEGCFIFLNVKMTIMAVPKMKTTSGNDFSVYFRRFCFTTFYEKILKTEKVTSISPILYGG